MYIYVMVLFFRGQGFGQEFFSSRPQYGIGISWSNHFVRAPSSGAAQTPLVLPYPFRTRPGSGMWAKRNKREVRKKMYFGRYTPEVFLDLGICRARTTKTRENIYLQVGIISKLASYFVLTKLFSWSHLEAFGLLCTSYV